MKKRTLIILAIALAGVAGSVAILLNPRQLSPDECSAVYRRYMDLPGIDASFLKDFPVNDTLRLDVTTLQATDSAGWERLKRDFHIADTIPGLQALIDAGEDKISIRLAPKIDPSLPTDTHDLTANNVIAVSRLHRTISLFHTRTMDEIQAVRRSKYE